MFTSDLRGNIVIGPDSKTEFFLKKILSNSGIKDVTVISLRCLNSHNNFLEVKELIMKDNSRLKMFHGSEDDLNNLKTALRLEERDDLVYMGRKFTARNLASSYWRYRFSRK